MPAVDHGSTSRLQGLQGRVRRLVPVPVRRADRRVFRAVARAHLPLVGPILPPLSRAANRSGLWIGVAAVLAGVSGRFGRRAGLRGLLAIALTSAVTNLPAKLLTGRVRPDAGIVPEVCRLVRVPTSTSFPSGHAASAFAFATAVADEQPRLRAPMVVLAGAVAFSRVFAGVHYPGDVLVGSAAGVAVARATRSVWPLADDRAAAARPAEPGVPRAEPDGTGLVVVANAGAGNQLRAAPARRLRQALPGMRIVVAEPGEDLAATLRRAAADARVLGVAGGDGSANAAASVAGGAGLPLAVVPTGTLNHLANDLGVERIEDAARAIAEGRAIRMDLGEIDGRPFVNAASIGVYPDLVVARERLEPRIGTWPATAWSMLQILFGHRPIVLRLDGRRRRVWFVFVGNGRFVAEGLAPSRRARLDDGVLDIRLVHAERSWARTRVAVPMLTGRLGRCSSYERWIAPRLEVDSAFPWLQLASDGETWRGSGSLVVRSRPRALVVMQPRPGRT